MLYVLLVIMLLSLLIIFFFFFLFFSGKTFCFIVFYSLFINLVCIGVMLYLLLYFQIVIQCYFSSFIQIGLLFLNFFFYFDYISCLLFLVVVCVSFCVTMFSYEYVRSDPHFVRYFCFLLLFSLCMLILITALDFIQFFLGWEGVGLCSYLLISFWSTRLQASKAAIKAMLTNRVGDFGLVLGFICLFGINKALGFSINFGNCSLLKLFFFNILNVLDINFLNICCCALFLGVMGKSAQVGLHVWLPDAMEGPTPVSALIHAATMVTAGVFLLIRCSILFEFCPDILFFILIVGILTTFFSGSVGIVQNDLKRVIAFSTCSQLGYMVCICGLSGYSISLFHLFNHAFFKAVLFLCAGCLIHVLSDEQDLRKMGGLRYILPYTYIIFLIGSLALLGFPFLSGFYSKDILLEFACCKYTFGGYLVFWLGSISAFFTSCYSFRMLFLIFFVKVNMSSCSLQKMHEIPFYLGFPIFILMIGSICSGFFFKDIFVGFGIDVIYSSIFILYQNSLLIDFEFIPLFLKFLPLMFSCLGFVIVSFYYIYIKKNIYFFFNLNIYVYYIYFFLNRKWFLDKLFNEYINQFFFIVSYFLCFCRIDRGVFEYCGSSNIFMNIMNYSHVLLCIYSSSYFDMLYLFGFFFFFFFY